MGCTCNAEEKENINPNRRVDEKNEKQENNNQKQLETQVIHSISDLDKKKCESLNGTLPKRTDTTLQSLKDSMKAKTSKLTDLEKSYIEFLWICQNVNYDIEGYFANSNVDCSPEGVFKSGKTVCSGYARLYRDIGKFLGLDVECVSCYAKGIGYKPGQKLKGTNHEYNVINLDNKWYPIDSTWGAGHVEGRAYVKELNEFYFLPDPELLIKTHFPANEKYQLTKQKYTLEDFLKWPEVKEKFFIYGFYKYSPDEGLITLNNTNTQKFIIWSKNMEKNGAMCNVYFLENNCYKQQLSLSKINFYNDRFEVDCIFNKKGQYNVEIFGNNDGTTHHNQIMGYSVNVEKDAPKSLKYPHTYNGSKEINIIEPLYDNLEFGKQAKFKIKSNLDTIIIIDKEWHYLTKNEEGYFEKEITINKEVGEKVVVGKKGNNGSCSYLVTYEVVK